MASGMLLSLIVFGAAGFALRRKPWKPRTLTWVTVAISATVAGALFGVALDKLLYESFGRGWFRWATFFAAGVLAPILCAHATMSGRSLPTFVQLLGPRDAPIGSVSTVLLGIVLMATALVAAEGALGLVFDPRYRDFPFAALSMAVVSFAGLMVANRPQEGVRPLAESVFAGILLLSAVYVGFNEGPNNWQSLWTCAAYLLFAVTLWRSRGPQQAT